MSEKVNQHMNSLQCPDNIIFYSAKFNEYGINIHDGGSSFIEISYCPWCGTKLPNSKRDLWFNTLEELGYDDPFNQNIPVEFNSENWYTNQTSVKNQTNYLPRNKHDFERVELLKNLNRNKLIPLLPKLLEWIQDMNWPIANDISELLLAYPTELIPLIKNVLASEDDVWKYWCLEILVKRMSKSFRIEFKDDLIKLAEQPTAAEKLEELDTIAIEILRTEE